jgi:4-hydroxy-3-polyprenylbenzoate decarboxylase
MCFYYWSSIVGRIVVGISGASGIILAQKAIKAIVAAGHTVDLVISKSALLTAVEELGSECGTLTGFLDALPQECRNQVTIHRSYNVGATIASGTYPTLGMLVIPCSMATLAAIAIGLSDNLLRRAADVTLKERRTLVVVPREAPLTEVHLQHTLTITRMGGIIVPPVPSWYTHPKTLDDVENFIVGKALDLLKIEHALYQRWNG